MQHIQYKYNAFTINKIYFTTILYEALEISLGILEKRMKSASVK